MASNCCLSLYLNVAGIRQGPGKMPLESWKSPGIFCNQESGNPATGTDNELLCLCPSNRRARRHYVFGLSIGLCMCVYEHVLRQRHSLTGLPSTSSLHRILCISLVCENIEIAQCHRQIRYRKC